MAADPELMALMGGKPVDTGAGPPGSVQQIQSAVGTSQAVPSESFVLGAPPAGATTATPTEAPKGKPPSVDLSGGIDILPYVGYAVEGVESDHRHIDPKTGAPLTNKSGVLGLMQVLPDTKGGHMKYGFDLNDEKQNKAAGMRELKEDYEKYGNWTDALIAYNWGQGNLDSFKLRGVGVNGQPMPNETKRYVPAVLARMGMSPGATFVEERSAGEKKSALTELMKGSEDEERKKAPDIDEDDSITAALMRPGHRPVSMSEESRDQAESMTYGAVQGVRDLGFGPVQAGLSMVSPELHRQFTQYVNEMDAPFQGAIAAHPYANYAGRTIGTTIALLAATRFVPQVAMAGILGRTMNMAIRSTPEALKAIGRAPAAIKAIAGGFGLGATSFNSDPDNANRFSEGLIGGILGGLGYGVARSVSRVIQKASDQQVVQNFMVAIRKNLEGLEASTSKIKDEMISVYDKALATRRTRYTTRDSAGREMQGYPSGYKPSEDGTGVMRTGLAQVVADAMEGDLKAAAGGFDQRSEIIRPVAKELAKKLGLDKQEDALALWEQQMKDFNESMDAFMKGPEGKNFATFERMGAGRGTFYLENLKRKGVDVPQPPPMFEPQPIRAEQMAEARRYLNRTLGDKRKIAPQGQVAVLKRAVDETAAKTAREAGIKDIKRYEDKQKAADKFHEETVVPLQQFFGGRDLRLAKKDTTNFEIYNKTIDLIKQGDREKIGKLFKVMSPQAKAEVRKAVEYDMVKSAVEPGLQDVINPKNIAKYVAEHASGLQEALGRDEFTKLAGKAKIAERLAREIKAEGVHGLLSNHPWIATYAMIKMFEGHPMEAARLGAGALGIEIVHNGLGFMNFVPRIMGPLLPRAARTEPNSAEMNAIMRSVDSAMNAFTKSQAQQLPEATGGEPLTSVGGAAQSMYYSIAGQP